MPLNAARYPIGAVILLAAVAASAQPAPPPTEPPAPAGAGPAPAEPSSAAPAEPGKAAQQVEIKGATDANAERRRSTASRIVFGREEIDRMGDATLGEVLKRLPGVTMGGPPGRGNQPRMRGMGSGYTAILIDGQRMPFGFSLDSISPDQIERIEIMRAPVAEFSGRAIAGIINVVMREDFKRKDNELRLGGGLEDGRRAQAGGNWTYSGQTESLGYNLSAAGGMREQLDVSDSHLLATDELGATTTEQFIHSNERSRGARLFLNGRFQYRFSPGHTLELQPMASLGRSHADGNGTLQQTIGRQAAPYAQYAARTDSDSSMARLGGMWLRTMEGGGRLQARFGVRRASSASLVKRDESDALAGLLRAKVEDSAVTDQSIDFSGKFSQLLAERHSVAAGWELESGRRNDRRTTTENGVPTLDEFGDTLHARTLRLAAFAQDEWEWSPSFSFYAGLRWEGIQTRSDALDRAVSHRSSVVTPLAHMVWKLPSAPRDQVRLSLTRSYRTPTTAQLIARPSLSSRYPDTSAPNQPISPDRAGNPDLRPELAWGLDLAFEHYLDAGGIVSANLFARRIDELIRTVRALETVPWASVPRWVARPQNVGSADSAGIELEAKLRASDLWQTKLPLSIRSNLSLFWSRVDGVPGPDNRIDQQPRYTANFGFDLPLPGTPLTLGSNLNFTPGTVVRQVDSQIVREGVKRVIDAYALWRFSALASARLSLSNVSARDHETGTTLLLADGSAQSLDTRSRSYTTTNLRAELRF